MVCTALTLIDPVVVRLLYRAYATPGYRYQWITFPLTDLVFLVLIWRERHLRAARSVFPAMLLVFATRSSCSCSISTRWHRGRRSCDGLPFRLT
jgi:hypothetical protein